jgi:predicted transcriptional regulator
MGKTAREVASLMDKDLATLKALGVSSFSYNLKDDKWRIYYTEEQNYQKTRRYYYSNAAKRVEGKTFEEAIEKLHKILADSVKSRMEYLRREAESATKKAADLERQAQELRKTSEEYKENAKKLV